MGSWGRYTQASWTQDAAWAGIVSDLLKTGTVPRLSKCHLSAVHPSLLLCLYNTEHTRLGAIGLHFCLLQTLGWAPSADGNKGPVHSDLDAHSLRETSV